MLDAPESEEELYLARGEVDCWRPVCQGDVFHPLQIPGRDDSCMAMVLSHPCAMRAGPQLRPRVVVVPVLACARDVPFSEWAAGHFREMPLPGLGVEGDAPAHAGLLEEPSTVPSELLDPAHRVALLTDMGVMLLQQRYIHNHSRFVAPLGTLHEVSATVLEEIELQESWNLALARPRVDNGEDRREVLAAEAEDFDDAMRTVPDGYSSCLRDLLKDPNARAMVRRTVTEAIQIRRP